MASRMVARLEFRRAESLLAPGRGVLPALRGSGCLRQRLRPGAHGVAQASTGVPCAAGTSPAPRAAGVMYPAGIGAVMPGKSS
jgi:hypothetical protein